MVRLLFWMTLNPDYNELIQPELESLATLFGLNSEEFKLSEYKDVSHFSNNPFDENGCYRSFDDYYKALLSGNTTEETKIAKNKQNVFYYANVPSIDTAIAIFDRSILLKGVIDVWVEGQSYDEIMQDIKCNHEKRIDETLVNKRWCAKFNCFNGKNDQGRQVAILEEMSELFDMAGKVDIKNPETKIAIIEQYEGDSSKHMEKIFFGHYIRDRCDIGYWWDKYSLTRRPILAPTTLDNMLAFIMANLALVKKGSVVLDPFVGSAGSLIAATHLGAICFGSDIDMRILKGWSMAHHNRNLPPSELQKNAYTNFTFYNLCHPDILRFDNRSTVWRGMLQSDSGKREWVDAIIADPPYGIRASAKNRRLLHDTADDGIVDSLIENLLSIAASMLVPGGRLVFLLPTKNNKIVETLQTLRHATLHVLHLGLQSLAGDASRFIVTLTKSNKCNTASQ
ncbi:RNA methylase family protein [Babesia bovis T2Bo]|uniref:RNA methylase, putative n=1 Tax=Babesia bovis TaxID=5865 RepID=A7AVQ9_BABBO|nr:RNA methylase family protein [Babesia bovis T2Bo]EDO05885.1 RNA methylase family protein [Babesia bovis T2Bo]|eukprot:XP_001609453.1 RNA methylase [Babesia bovis T2Bo]